MHRRWWSMHGPWRRMMHRRWWSMHGPWRRMMHHRWWSMHGPWRRMMNRRWWRKQQNMVKRIFFSSAFVHICLWFRATWPVIQDLCHIRICLIIINVCRIVHWPDLVVYFSHDDSGSTVVCCYDAELNKHLREVKKFQKFTIIEPLAILDSYCSSSSANSAFTCTLDIIGVIEILEAIAFLQLSGWLYKQVNYWDSCNHRNYWIHKIIEIIEFNSSDNFNHSIIPRIPRIQ